MQSIKNILVVIDPTVERDFVVERAKMIARAAAAKVVLFINSSNTLNEHSYLYEGIDGDFFKAQSNIFETRYRKILDGLVEEFTEENIEVSSLYTEHHHLAESIIGQAIESSPDLVLKSTHHHSAIGRALVTNTDWRLIRKCPPPLLLVKPNPWKTEGSIVAAVDPFHSKADQSHLSHSLISHAELLSSLLQQATNIFHSFFPFVSTMFPMGSESYLGLERMRDEHAKKLNELLQDHNIAEGSIELSAGEIVPNLIKHLKTVNANMLIIGVLSRNVIERAIVGNTAEKILEGCPCDVLVIKPPQDN